MTSAIRNQPRRLGSAGPPVFPLALGCMGMSGMYGAGHNELLIGRALQDRRDKALLSHQRDRLVFGC